MTSVEVKDVPRLSTSNREVLCKLRKCNDNIGVLLSKLQHDSVNQTDVETLQKESALMCYLMDTIDKSAGVFQPLQEKTRGTSLRASPSEELMWCHYCGATETPEWRKGPDGKKSLCNACGLYYAKQLKKEKNSNMTPATASAPQSSASINMLLNPN